MQYFGGLILLSSSIAIVTNGYSIGYFTNSIGKINGNVITMTDYPNVYQVADIYSRLGGLPPLLLEGKFTIFFEI